MINYDELAKRIQNRYCPGCSEDCYECIMDDIDKIKLMIEIFFEEIKILEDE